MSVNNMPLTPGCSILEVSEGETNWGNDELKQWILNQVYFHEECLWMQNKLHYKYL